MINVFGVPLLTALANIIISSIVIGFVESYPKTLFAAESHTNNISTHDSSAIPTIEKLYAVKKTILSFSFYKIL